MIPQETIQKIIEATRIEEVVGQFVSLRRRGSGFVGCCPFHNEKTSSFVVTPARGIFKCFGCGKAGDAVRFLMEHERYTYPEALHFLADKYHIEIEEQELTPEQQKLNSERDSLFHVSEFAQLYFADLLFNDEMGRAVGLSYFHARGLSDDIIKKFGLGYCLDERTAFTDHARQQGYSDNALEKSGLTIFKDGHYHDRFRGRVMFPIFSISGRVLGFSGRILTKDKALAKYVNSPDSEIYNKSHILYGIYQARTAIARQNKCFLVEGNVDVVSMHQSGVENTVASCGTSLTVEQARMMKRYAENVTILYDGDAAGIKAALRAVNLLLEEGLHVRVVLFPDGEDPDSYAQKYGSTRLQSFLAEAEENFIAFKIRVLGHDVQNDPIRKAEVVKELVKTIALVPDLIERNEYIALCATRMGVAESTLQIELATAISQRTKQAYEKSQRSKAAPSAATTDGTTPAAAAATPTSESQQAPQPTTLSIDTNPDEQQERKIISLLVNYGPQPLVTTTADDNPDDVRTLSVTEVIVNDIEHDELSFETPLYQSAFNIFAQHMHDGDLIDGRYLVSSPDEELRSMAASMMVESYPLSQTWRKKHIHIAPIEDNLLEDVDQSMLTFKQKKLERKIKENAEQIAAAEANNDVDTTIRLLQERVMLDGIKTLIAQQLKRVINP